MYHRKLKCLVALELKSGKFKPEYIGKMGFYLTALDKVVKLEGENKSIGLIICKDKNRTVVEYALQDTKKPMGVATYQSGSSNASRSGRITSFSRRYNQDTEIDRLKKLYFSGDDDFDLAFNPKIISSYKWQNICIERMQNSILSV